MTTTAGPPPVAGFGLETTAEGLGLAIVGATAAGFAAHGVGKVVQHKVAEQRRARAAAGPGGLPAATPWQSTGFGDAPSRERPAEERTQR
jgi:hypothetical protein